MKQLILTTTLLCFSLLAHSQEVWEPLPINSNADSTVHDIEMVNGNVYQAYYKAGGTNELSVEMYSKKTSTWKTLAKLVVPADIKKIVTEQINGIIYIATYDGIGFNFYTLNPSIPTLSTSISSFAFTTANDNWEFHSGKNTGELYVLFTSDFGPSIIHGIEYTTGGGNTWTEMQESSSQDLSTARLQIESSATDVYFGVYSNKLRLTRFIKGDIATIFAYDGGISGEVLTNGGSWVQNRFALSGNKNDLPFFYGTDDASNKSYEAVIDGSTIDINTSDPSTGFNLDTSNIAKESGTTYAYILSPFSTDGLGNPNDNLILVKKDITTVAANWVTYGPGLITAGTTDLDPNSVRLSINNTTQHLAASYSRSGFSNNEILVLNNRPYEITSSVNPNTGLCANQMNEIYGSLELMDDDLDQITILSAVSVGGGTSSISVVPNGFSNGKSKFKIYGFVGSGSDEIKITYSDGYNTQVLTLGTFVGSTTPIDLQFTSNPLKICSNQLQVDLSEQVNYYDRGAFRLNGQLLTTSLLNASTLNPTTGTLRYTVNVSGCIVSALTTYNVVDPPQLSVVTTPTSCSQASGVATVTITPGTSTVINSFWSTGESTNTISDLVPGAYYAFAEDDNKCRATKLASIETSDITITETLTNPTCFGAKDGSISLVVSGVSGYTIVWSDGQFGETATNLDADNHEFTLYTTTGCEIHRTYTLTTSPEVKINLSATPSDCAGSTGAVTSTASGGTGNYSYLWNTNAVTPNLTGVASGKYALVVTDDAGCSSKDSIYVDEKLGVEITDSVFLSDCNGNNGGIDVTLTPSAGGGTVESILWSNGETSEDLFNLTSDSYLITVTSTDNCQSNKLIHVGIKPPVRNDICIVTVDDTTTTNLVVWEKPITDEINHYNIYRENTLAGKYKWIDTVHYTNLSVFNDVIASPIQRSWRYRIAAVNHCNVEGPLSAPHKTLHLNTIVQVGGQINVYWDDYEGLTTAEYIVNRFSDQNGWEELTPTVPFGNPTVFIDTPPVGATSLDYYVSLNLNTPCTATYRAQDFNASRSNKEKGVFSPGSGTGNSNNEVVGIQGEQGSLLLYPNPFNKYVEVELVALKNTTVYIRNVQGQLVAQQVCVLGTNRIETTHLNSGVYFVSAEVEGITHTFKIVK